MLYRRSSASSPVYSMMLRSGFITSCLQGLLIILLLCHVASPLELAIIYLCALKTRFIPKYVITAKKVIELQHVLAEHPLGK